MKKLPNTNFTFQELEKIMTREPIVGGEAYIYKSGKNTLYKIFCRDEENDEIESLPDVPIIATHGQIITMSDNKFQKIKRLYQMQLENSVRPLSTISCQGQLIGYEMTYDKEDRTLTPGNLSREELIYYLEKTKEILEYFGSKDIIYGDVADRNILINTKNGTVKFCDMDNICLEAYPIDKLSWYLSSYCEERGILDEYTDAYMHNFMTLLHFGIGVCTDYVNKEYFNRQFSPQAVPILDAMSTPKRFNGEYIIQYVKK